jgi:Domain of unknown function (DUF4157)
MSQRTMMQRERERETALTSVQEVLSSSGQPLDADTQNFMGASFGHDFSNVRVHTDERAGESAQAVNALAYTVGNDVVFDGGEYMPETETGRHLLAHELAHVIQQSRGGLQTPLPIPTHPLEQSAQQAASIITSGGTVHVEGASAWGIARQSRSLNESLDPRSMADEDLAQEIALIRQWLDENPVSSSEQTEIVNNLSVMETEVAQRNGQRSQNNAASEQTPDIIAGSNGVGESFDTSILSEIAEGGNTVALPNNGPTLSSGEQPASFHFDGLPAFRYNVPSIPIAQTHIEMPNASMDVELYLRGSVTVTFLNSLPGITADLDKGTFRYEASHAVDGLFTGLRINDINSEEISFGATIGTEFLQTEFRFSPPDTVSYIGQLQINRTQDTSAGKANLQSEKGQCGFELRITVTRKVQPVQVDEKSWFSYNATSLAVIEGCCLAITAVVLVPETGGGSLLPIFANAFALAPETDVGSLSLIFAE